MATELSAPPDRLTAGTTLVYRRTYPDFPALAWQLTFYLVGKSVLVPVSAVASGTEHVVTVPASATATLAQGSYSWTERATNGIEAFDVASGQLIVAPNPATATPGSQEAWEEQALEAVRGAIKGNLSAGLASFQIAGRAVQNYSIMELLNLESNLATRVARRRRSGGVGRQILGGFTTTGFDR